MELTLLFVPALPVSLTAAPEFLPDTPFEPFELPPDEVPRAPLDDCPEGELPLGTAVHAHCVAKEVTVLA